MFLLCSVCPRTLAEGVNGRLLTTLAETELSGTAQLARFFPDVQPVGPPYLLRLLGPGSAGFREAVAVEFSGADKVIFASALPLEFADRVRLEDDRGRGVEAKVIAVQYQQGKTVVAVEILDVPSAWMKRP
jgi:hypothetical protein